jgi:hypothetical protein
MNVRYMFHAAAAAGFQARLRGEKAAFWEPYMIVAAAKRLLGEGTTVRERDQVEHGG